MFTAQGLSVGMVADPAMVDVVCAERQRAYGSDGPGEFGRVPYDDYGEHLVAISNVDERPVGSMRIGHGPRLLEHDGFRAFELSRYWKADRPPEEFLHSSIELTRVWATRHDVPGYRFILPALWRGLHEYLEARPEVEHIVGAVALIDYPRRAAERVIGHVVRFHPAQQTIFSPIAPAPTGRVGGLRSVESPDADDRMAELGKLNQELRSRDSRKGVPPLLYLYASIGMAVLAAPGYDETGRGILIPVHARRRNLAASFEAMRGILREAA